MTPAEIDALLAVVSRRGYEDGGAVERKATLGEALATTWPAMLVQSILSGAALPGDVYAGRASANPKGMSAEEFARVLDLAGVAGSGALASSAAQKSRASRSASLYDPPAKKPRPFEADYPAGAPSDAAGRLTHSIDGDPLTARVVAGRNFVGEPDLALPREALDEIAKARTGEGIRAVAPRSPDIGNDVGRAVFRRSGEPDHVAVSRALTDSQFARVAAHEIAHVIDQTAGQIPTAGLRRELDQVYSILYSGRERPTNLMRPGNAGYKGGDVPRELMAEAIRAYMADPNFIKTVAPNTAARIRAYVNKNPKLRETIQFNQASVPGAGAVDERPERRSGGRVQPTEAQKEAGNYRKDHVVFQGLPISIETKKGQKRTGRAANGKEWSVRMPADYGYFKRTEGADGDQVDVYVGPDKAARTAWVIDQTNARTGAFDEHKVMLGFKSRGHAEMAYCSAFSDGRGRKRLGSIVAMTIPMLKAWLASNRTTKSLAEVAAG